MTRLALFGALILTATYSAADDKKDVSKELQPFQGVWKLVKVEIGGKEPKDKPTEEVRLTFAGSKLSIKEGKREADEGTYTVDSKKDPAEIDLINAKSEKALGIYKFEKDDKLTVSFIKKPNAMRPKKFDEAEAVVLVMEKVKE
jgi:uncharacterized protein (TIGR03067 family)